MPELPFGFEKPADSPGFLLWQTTIIWQRLIKDALEPYDVSHSQFVIMALLLWFEKNAYDTTQILIVNWSKLDKMTVSKAINKLLSKGFLTRFEHKTDTRAKSVLLTASGKKLIYKLVKIVENVDANFFGGVSTMEQKKLMNILHKFDKT